MLMKSFLLAALPMAIIASSLVHAKSDTNIQIKPKIVGGSVADQGDWPWMSALVYTFDEVSASLTVDSSSIDAQAFTNSPAGNASGALVDCGIGDQSCADATDKVCLIERGEINFSEKALNCEAGGGVGVIIYNNATGLINGTLGDDFTGTIPAVGITQSKGQELLANLGSVASLDVSQSASLAQDSTCGASFLGGRWVLTASHCVEGVNINSLKVNVGEYDLSDGANNAKSIKNIYMHPDYDDVSLNNDVALIELNESVDVPAITIASRELTDQVAMENSLATVMGWGGREGYEPGEGPTSDFPDVLHQVDLTLLSNQECTQTLGGGITNQMICATVTGGGKGSCQGDSGGPLVVNTNEGWQQVGIVSWGIGCAADGYPGVYARAASFDTWLAGIYQGIAIDQTAEFNIVPAGQSYSQSLEVTNNTDMTATLTFDVQGADNFALDASQCGSLAASESCQLTVNLTSDSAVDAVANINISTDVSNLPTSSSRISATVIDQSSDINTALDNSSDKVTWYSGGDLNWITNTVDGGISSGAIDHNQDSIVMAVIEGEGELSFEWSVSSEENVDDPSSPYDALYLYVNDEPVTFISGEIDFEAQALSLSEGTNRVTWVYRKDPAASEFDDKGYLRNVLFTSTEVEPPTPAPTPTPTPTPEPNNSSSSGGSMAWLSLLLIGLMRFRK